MIDTNRYDLELWRDAETKLIADAPLLLAEILRLQEVAYRRICMIE